MQKEGTTFVEGKELWELRCELITSIESRVFESRLRLELTMMTTAATMMHDDRQLPTTNGDHGRFHLLLS